MKRREMLISTGTAALAMAAWPLRFAAGAEKKAKVLYFTRSAGYEHSVVKRQGGDLSHSEKVLTEMGAKANIEIECSKDGRLFDGDLDKYDAFAFYTSGDLTREKQGEAPPMSAEGKQRLLDAVAGGKGFVAFHAACDSFHTPGPRNENQAEPDPYLAMLGGEFITHGAQQETAMRVVSKFPGTEGLGKSFQMREEWYALKNFARDMHVILVQETEGMKGDAYQRPPFPATWARKHGQGRVFFTSMGHREDVWTSEVFQQVVLGGFAWTLGRCEADVTPNLEQVTPKAFELPKT